jgi:L-alanine-DL-glutamate epimerase-like enolase superfamily enzyme
MKVASIDAYIVLAPSPRRDTWRLGRRPGLTNAIVDVRADEKIAGIGEVPGNPQGVYRQCSGSGPISPSCRLAVGLRVPDR